MRISLCEEVDFSFACLFCLLFPGQVIILQETAKSVRHGLSERKFFIWLSAYNVHLFCIDCSLVALVTRCHKCRVDEILHLWLRDGGKAPKGAHARVMSGYKLLMANPADFLSHDLSQLFLFVFVFLLQFRGTALFGQILYVLLYFFCLSSW